MKPYERRAANAWPYFKLATWDDRNMTWRDGKTVQETEPDARREARKPGRYRISRIDESGRFDLEPFAV
jgi:hypothetical protein